MNKYLAIFLIVFIGYFTGNSIYIEMTKDKTPGKAKRLACQKEVTSFERSFSDPDIKYVQSLIEHGSIDFSSYIEKAIYSESKLFNYIGLSEMAKKCGVTSFSFCTGSPFFSEGEKRLVILSKSEGALPSSITGFDGRCF